MIRTSETSFRRSSRSEGSTSSPRTGRQALDFLSLDVRSRPDFVILDLMMPIVTGWQVLEEMRQRPDLEKIPVIVLTAVSQDMPTGAVAVLRKPFDINHLLTILSADLQ